MSTQGSGRSSGSDLLEVKRQVFHLVLISLWIVPILFFPFWITFVVMLLVTGINLAVVMRWGPFPRMFGPLIDHLEREENLHRPGIQSLYANLGVLISFLLFGELSAFGVAVLAVGDSLSTLVGRSLGGTRIFFNTSKSWEGTLAFFGGTYLVTLPFLDTREALMISLTTSLAEALRTPADDNLLLPVLGSALAYLTW
jgi:dolichol kinase